MTNPSPIEERALAANNRQKDKPRPSPRAGRRTRNSGALAGAGAGAPKDGVGGSVIVASVRIGGKSYFGTLGVNFWRDATLLLLREAGCGEISPTRFQTDT
jgi:hypothetical protein